MVSNLLQSTLVYISCRDESFDGSAAWTMFQYDETGYILIEKS